jgi:hypothetical protein
LSNLPSAGAPGANRAPLAADRDPVVVAEDFRINSEPRSEGAMTDLRVDLSSAGASLDIRVL